MTKEDYLLEAQWVQCCLEVLNMTSTDRIQKQVDKLIPSAKEKCRGWKDWERYALSHLDRWEQQFLKDAYETMYILDKKQFYTKTFYDLCYKSAEG